VIGSLDVHEPTHSVRILSSNKTKKTTENREQKRSIQRTHSSCSERDLKSMEEVTGLAGGSGTARVTGVAKPKSSERGRGRGRFPLAGSDTSPRSPLRARSLSRPRDFKNSQEMLEAFDDILVDESETPDPSEEETPKPLEKPSVSYKSLPATKLAGLKSSRRTCSSYAASAGLKSSRRRCSSYAASSSLPTGSAPFTPRSRKASLGLGQLKSMGDVLNAYEDIVEDEIFICVIE
jgi:hypothetical protein